MVLDFGTVLSVKDGVVRASGLHNVSAGEMVKIGNVFGMVLNLEIDIVAIVIFGADTYTNDLLVNLLKFKCNLHFSEAGIHGQIDEMAEILKSTTISPALKIETYKEMSINLLGTLSEKKIRGFNPSFLVIDNAEEAYKRLPDINSSRCVFDKMNTGLTGFTTKKEHQAVILNTIKVHTPQTLKYMVEAKGTELETPLTGMNEIISNL